LNMRLGWSNLFLDRGEGILRQTAARLLTAVKNSTAGAGGSREH
jgi:hypothetical protein